jgi:hypothetical protein
MNIYPKSFFFAEMEFRKMDPRVSWPDPHAGLKYTKPRYESTGSVPASRYFSRDSAADTARWAKQAGRCEWADVYICMYIKVCLRKQ